RQEHLDAPAFAAVARRARKLVGRHPRQRIVSPLARDEVDAVETTAADDDSPTDAGTQDDAEDDIRSPGRAVRGFRDRETVRVVLEANGPPESCLEISAQRLPDQPDGVGVFHQSSRWRDGSRNTDADCPTLAGRSFDGGHQTHDRVETSVVAARR